MRIPTLTLRHNKHVGIFEPGTLECSAAHLKEREKEMTTVSGSRNQDFPYRIGTGREGS